MDLKQTYTILETKLNESLGEQIKLQSIDINDIMKETSIIKELSDALNEDIDDEPSVLTTS